MTSDDSSKSGKGRKSGASRGKGGRRGRKSPQPATQGWMEWVKTFGIAIVLFLVIRSFLIQTFVITSGSMEDSLLVGDFLMVNRLSLGSPIPGTQIRIPGYSEPIRGDVTVFDPPHEEDLKLVKRLVGMPGDTLEMRDKVLYVDGVAQVEPYVKHVDPLGDESHPWMEWQRAHLVSTVNASEYRPTRDNWGPVVIPPGHYFMLGDNRDSSLDSRYWGLLERWRLEGKAFFIYFSYDREALVPFPFVTEVRWGRIFDGIRRMHGEMGSPADARTSSRTGGDARSAKPAAPPQEAEPAPIVVGSEPAVARARN